MKPVAYVRLTALGLAVGVLLPSTLAAADRLIDAVKRQDRTEIQILVKGGADVRARQADGATALHWAAYHDDAASVGALIRAGADVNALTDSGLTPLWVACQANAGAATVTVLLDGGANPNAASRTGETPLMWCARTGTLDAVKALVSHGADVNAREKSAGQTALMWAVAARHPDVVKTLLEVRADPRARADVFTELVYKGFRYITSPPVHSEGVIENVKRGGFTPLLFAAQQGDGASAQFLLAAGADVNDVDASGTSVLVTAAHSGHGALAQQLLEQGADPNAAKSGYTALHAAVLRGDVNLVKALIAKGANVDAPLAAGTPVRKYGVDYALSAAWIGATPYWLAAKFGEAEIMRVLAGAAADTRRGLPDGTTPLMAALMAGGGQGDRRERFQTEAQAAAAAPTAEEDTLAVVKAALELGVDVNAANTAGDTALHTAAVRGPVPAVQLLVDAGAALDARNKQGLTPLAAAARRRGPGAFDADSAPAGPTPSQRAAALLRSLGAKE